MSRRSEKGDGSRNRRRVLRDYRREGKRFIPPILQHLHLTESEWIDDRVPELIWIALLIQVFGLNEGTEVAVSIAKTAAKCYQAPNKAFAAASDYAELSDQDKQCVRLALKVEGMLDKSGRGLAALIHHYTGFPLAFLEGPRELVENGPSSTLDDLRTTIDNIRDRQSRAAIFAQATLVYIFFINDQLRVSPHVGLANLPAIEEYPMTDESQRVAASVRSAVTGLLTTDISSDWGISFWDQGHSFGPCEVT